MPIEIRMPALSPTMEEGNLAKWLKAEGDNVAAGDIIAEIETDKATMEFEAVDEGVIGKIIVAEGSEGVAVNDVIAILLEEGESATDIKDSVAEAPAVTPPKAPVPVAAVQETAPPTNQDKGARVFASPLARRIARDKGIALDTLTGTGPHGRIVRADVEGAHPAAAPAQAPAALPPGNVASSDVARLYADREFEEVALDGMRKIIAARLSEAKSTIPHFYLRRDIRLDALLEFRAELNGKLAAKDVKLSVNDFIIKACALALQDEPDCNAVWAGDRILKMKASDVAVAVAIEGGLFTPVLRDADTKTLSRLSAEMKDLATRARDRKLAPNEYQGGSFAISNLGMMGIENFDAVINPPHGSILAVGAGIKKPIVNEDGALDTATVMSVTLSVDHRVIDGALGAQFLAAIKGYLEDPLAMLA